MQIYSGDLIEGLYNNILRSDLPFLVLKIRVIWYVHQPIVWIHPDKLFNLIDYIIMNNSFMGKRLIETNGSMYRNIFQMRYGFALPMTDDTMELYFQVPISTNGYSGCQLEIRLKESLFGFIKEGTQFYTRDLIQSMPCEIHQF